MYTTYRQSKGRILQGNLAADTEQPRFSVALISLFVIFACWIFVFWQGLSTSIDIWWMSEIFNHCLFVLPGTAYFIYLKKEQLKCIPIKPNYLALVLCIGCLLLYAIGLAGDVQLFMHVATFSFLPFVIWAYVGNKLAYQILFPLAFILFCIPIGEELIPTLQEVTTDMAMVMLNWTGIPIYRSGLYIEIPQGRFLVAEACSGISFFIASIVIGSLYAYLNMRSAKRRIVFMAISIIFPIIANAIRVFGIILTGYLSDMEHAVGADHLIYGWIFFSLVIICLLAIGELIREKKLASDVQPSTSKEDEKIMMRPVSYVPVFVIILLMFAFWIWFNGISSQLTESTSSTKLVLSTPPKGTEYNSNWSPEFIEPYQEHQYRKQVNSQKMDVYLAWYPKGQGELISSLNRLYIESAWTLESVNYFALDTEQQLGISTIVNTESKRLLVSWYVIDGKTFTDKRKAKLFEIYRILTGEYTGSGLVAISIETDNVSLQEDTRLFEEAVRNNLKQLNQHFDFE